MIENPYELYQDVVERYSNGESIDIVKLRQLLLDSDEIYSKGERTPLSDEEYDRIHQIYMELTGEVIRGDMNARTKVKHDYPELKGTVRKVHYITRKEKLKDPGAVEAHKVLYEWYIKTYDQLDPTKNHYLGFWPKYDGCSLILSLDENHKVVKAITRGDEEYGVDKSHLFTNIVLDGIIPDQFEGPVGLKCECIMPKSLFKEYNENFGDPNKPFANERTAMTSLLNSETFTKLHSKFINLRPLMMSYHHELKSFTMDDGGFGPVLMIPYEKEPTDEAKFEECIKEMKKFIDSALDFECDGVIVRWYDENAMRTLGRDYENYVNRFEIAYKFPKANNYTHIIDIRQDIGMLGKVSYTAILEPIKINDKIIKHASLGSYDRAKGLHLAIGDLVNIKYEIVPYLCIDSHCEENRSGKDPIKLITECPYCGHKLELNPELSCVNPDCPSRIQGKINNFCIRMNISGIGQAVIEDLFHAGLVTSIEDLFDLKNKEETFCALDGYGKKTFKALCKQFRKLTATEAQIISAISIPGFGPKKSKQISDIYYISELLQLCKSDYGVRILMERGFTESTSEKFLKGVFDNYDLITFLINHVKIEKADRGKHDTNGVIVFTGFRNPIFKKHLEKLGYQVDDSITKKTTLVIAFDPDARSGKLDKAREKGIPVTSMAEAYVMFKFKN